MMQHKIIILLDANCFCNVALITQGGKGGDCKGSLSHQPRHAAKHTNVPSFVREEEFDSFHQWLMNIHNFPLQSLYMNQIQNLGRTVYLQVVVKLFNLNLLDSMYTQCKQHTSFNIFSLPHGTNMCQCVRTVILMHMKLIQVFQFYDRRRANLRQPITKRRYKTMHFLEA